MRITLSILLLAPLFIFSQNEKNVTEYAKSITPNELKELLYVYASDYFEGRETGTRGQKKAVDFIRQFYSSHAINAAQGTEDYFQPMELNIKGKMVKTENVAAIIEGSEFPDEYIVISSHLDHVGIQNGMIHNGADDDGSGSVSLLEIAEAFQEAAAAGQGPKRSILFLHVTGEEKGLLGSAYYANNPLYPLANTMVNLNVDMIGRLDPKREDKDPNYIYLIGADKISQELHDISEATNKRYTQIKLDYTFNDDKDPNRFYYRSDHYNFAKKNIPVIFYFNGTHEDYHAPGDTPDKINYEMLAKRSQLIFHTAWELANRNDRIKIN
ncbi:MAG: M28 family peptidase [Flavobacteriaceae bacterium]|jgi:Zn-dependent M28 family amino/carboxypeptidase|nr:M28 family peptidase [Flavobacteriaceae bacterium]MBT4312744.1 M28 family peptidase [Flavobacteriaceae bacterium]MBT5091692.1 M28 family peptidase [Flavobacteriaceae bacterium]MBT5283768.1 M28 family peptidase [Flavobacteriaceae bacterium]MBT5447317.1 M28 family peptidase [Flavobacteriaceae bacterium]|tara:strand:+ start:9099 stop:10076 length:978 start_codon:yes stop_codon:yes gene_type:complete